VERGPAGKWVNARNRFAREILRCKNYQIRPDPIEIVSIGYEVSFVFAGALLLPLRWRTIMRKSDFSLCLA